MYVLYTRITKTFCEKFFKNKNTIDSKCIQTLSVEPSVYDYSKCDIN